MDGRAELELLLRPAAGGRAAQAKLQRQIDRVDDDAAVRGKWIASARGVILGIPSDVGAGSVRGGDIMEVAPPHETTTLAARYLRETIAATLKIDL